MKIIIVLFILVIFSIVIMNKLSNISYVKQVLSSVSIGQENKNLLNTRFRGYTTKEVEIHWQVIKADKIALKSEQLFLKLDLIYPLVYGFALIIGFYILWTNIGRSFNPLWFIVPILVAVFADWCENIIQIDQLNHYVEIGVSGLDEFWIKIVSIATIVKLYSISSVMLFFVSLLIMSIFI